MKHKCPVCKKIIDRPAKKQTETTVLGTPPSGVPKRTGGESFPFCSQRCKLIDLGAWLDADYKIVSESSDTPSDTDQEKQDNDRS